MPIGFRSSSQAHPGSTTASLTITKPTGTVNGDLILVFAGNTGPGAQALTGFAEVSDVAAGGDIQGSLYWKIASGEGASWNVTVSSATNMFGMAAAYTGCIGVRDDSSNPTSTNSGTSGSTTSPVPTALTGVTASDMVVQMVTVGSDTSGAAATTLNYPNTGTYPGWNQRDKMNLSLASGSTWAGGCGFVDQLGATGTMPRWTVAATARQWVSLSVALIAAPSGGNGFFPFMAHHDERNDDLAGRRTARRHRSGLYLPDHRHVPACRSKLEVSRAA